MIHRMGRHVRDAILGAVLALAAALILMTPMVVESPFFPSNGLPFFGAPSASATPGEVVPPTTTPRPVG
jgi:hypothetical protein